MDTDWFEWARNISSVTGVVFVLRYVAIAFKNGISKLFDYCTARDRIKLEMQARAAQNRYTLDLEIIRFASHSGEYGKRFQSQDDEDGTHTRQDTPSNT